MMSLSWGLDLWDCLDQIINHSNTCSSIIDKCYKYFIECNNVWTKAAHKQKRLLEKLQCEIRESTLDEFTLTASLYSFINNLTSISNIESTFRDALGKTADEFMKKTNSQIKKQTSAWSMEKRKMEDDLARERRKYDLALKRYRDKYQAMIAAEDSAKKSDDNRALSRSQVDMYYNSYNMKRDEFDESKRDYAVELTNFNNLQQTHFSESVVVWANKGEKLYEQRLSLLKSVAIELAKYTNEMVKNLSYSATRFNDTATSLSFEKDALLLVQKFKTGDVPPGELQFIELDHKLYLTKQCNSLYGTMKDSAGTSTTGSSTSSFESNIGIRPDTVCTGSLSSMAISTNTRSEPSRPSVHSVKMRDTGKMMNPEARFSIRKSSKIFRSAAPWKNSTVSSTSLGTSESKVKPEKQKSLYQRRGRSSVKERPPQQRSHSVSEMISNAFRTSFRLKSNPDIAAKDKKKTNSAEVEQAAPVVRRDSSDYDTDSSEEQCKSDDIHGAPEIVSTPAEAVALTNGKSLSQGYTMDDSVDGPTIETEAVYEMNGDDMIDYTYVGSCASYHSYDSNDPSNKYLSFKAGDQFYILTMDEGSGWLFVETVDRKFRGYVPTSYMAIQHFDKQSDDVI